eukprot:676419-Lingulodinium_polyedra.AAC.1
MNGRPAATRTSAVSRRRSQFRWIQPSPWKKYEVATRMPPRMTAPQGNTEERAGTTCGEAA